LKKVSDDTTARGKMKLSQEQDVPQGSTTPDNPPVKAERKHLSENAGMRAIMPIGRSGWAIAAGYLGLFSFIPGLGVFAAIFGIVAVRHIKKNTNKHGLGRAIFGIVAGVISIIAYVVVLIEGNYM